MKKLPIIIASLALAVGAGVGVANSKLDAASAAGTYTIDFKDSGSANDGTSEKTALKDLVTDTSYFTSVSASKVYQGKSGYGLKFSSSSAAGSLTLNWNQVSKAINPTTISFNLATYGSDTTSVKIGVNGSNKLTQELTSTFTDYSVTMDGSTLLTSLSVAAASSSKQRFYLKSITIQYNEATAPTDSVSLSESSGTIMAGNTKTITATASGNVVWSTGNSSIATVSGSGDKNATATITAVSAGETKITATVGTAKAEYSVKVAPAITHAGTLADPFSVQDIINAIDNSLLSSGKRYYVKGLFSKYANNGEYSTQYGNSSFFVKDNLTDEADFEFYHAGSTVAPTFEVGDEVIASATTANFKKYNSTYEFATGDLYNPIESVTASLKAPITNIGTTLNTSDLNVTVNYKHATVTVTDGTGVTVNGASSTVLNEANNTVTVKYINSGMGSFEGPKEATYDLSINGLIAKVVSSIDLTGSLTKTSYTTVDESWDLSGLSITATFSTGDTMSVALNNEDVTVTTNPATPTFGTTSLKVTATYEGKSSEKTYDVTVVKARKAVYVKYATYDLTDAETTLKASNAVSDDAAKDLFSAAYSGDSDTLVSAKVTGSVYYGNSSGGPFTGTGMIRFGTNSAIGSITLTYLSDVKIGKVILSAHDWNKDKAAEGKVSVTGSNEEPQSASTTGTYAPLTFTIKNPTNSFTFGTSTKRSFVNKVTVYQDVTYTANATSVFDFIDNYMHMDDVSTDDVSNTGACAGSTGYYALASVAYNALNAAAKELFCTNEAFALEHARLVAWATANGQTIDANNNLVAASRIASSIESSSTQMIVVIISITCISLLGAALIMKKRKHQ